MTSFIPTAIRQPLCLYYSSDKAQLLSELRWCFNYFSRPGSVAARDESTSWHDKTGHLPPFLILPHGAFCDSGPLVAEALLELDDFFRPSTRQSLSTSADGHTVILIGTEHNCTAQNFLCLGGFAAWRTLLGDVPVDLDLFEKLSKVLPIETDPFVSEHSIENQLPFLQYLAAQRNITEGLRIVPLSVRGSVSATEFRDICCADDGILPSVAEILQQHCRTTQMAVIATTDLNHIGPAYGFVPTPPETIPDCIRRLDGPVLQAIQSNSLERLFAVGSTTSMCGLGAACVWMRLLHLFSTSGVPCIRRLRHIVGSDIGPQHNDQTGFATFVAMFCRQNDVTVT